LPVAQGAVGQIFVNDGSGNLSNANSSSAVNTVRKTADQTTGLTTLVDVTNLSFPVAANTDYTFDFYILFRQDANLSGITLTLNGPAAPTYVSWKSQIDLTTTTSSLSSLTAYGALHSTANVDTANVNRSARLWGVVRNGTTAGTVTVQFKTPGSASDMVTIMQGSWGIWY